MRRNEKVIESYRIFWLKVALRLSRASQYHRAAPKAMVRIAAALAQILNVRCNVVNDFCG